MSKHKTKYLIVGILAKDNSLSRIKHPYTQDHRPQDPDKVYRIVGQDCELAHINCDECQGHGEMQDNAKTA